MDGAGAADFGEDEAGAAVVVVACDDAAVAGFGETAGFGGAGFSGLIPPSQDGPE